jgi:2-O-methyltransferase
MIFDTIKELLKDTVRPVIVELGACDGNETVTFVKMFPDCSIVALEPVPKLAEIIRSRPELMGRVDVEQKAIGKENGITTLYVSSGTCESTSQNFYASSSIKTPLYATKVFKGMEFNDSQCEVITLDSLWKQRGSGVIDFIWADIQGAEREMIEGGLEALKHTRYLYTEVHEGDYYEGEISAKEILELLPDWEMVEDFGTDVLIRNKRFNG